MIYIVLLNMYAANTKHINCPPKIKTALKILKQNVEGLSQVKKAEIQKM